MGLAVIIEDIERTVRNLRSKPLLPPERGLAVGLDRSMIQRLIPHRPPLLLIDSIDRVDLDGAAISGRRFVEPNDPLLAGHFPGDPVYPGVLQVEMMGQLGLCLAGLLDGGTVDPRDIPTPARIRASRIHQSVFYAGVAPGDTLRIHASLVDRDAWAATAAGQIYRGDTLCSVSLLEVCVADPGQPPAVSA